MASDLAHLINQIDVSDLSVTEQVGFNDWLDQRPQMQTTIKNALRRGQSVKALFTTWRKQIDYSVRIED